MIPLHYVETEFHNFTATKHQKFHHQQYVLWKFFENEVEILKEQSMLMFHGK